MVDRRVKVTAELDARGMVEGARQAESAVARTGQAMKRTADQTEQAAKGQESAFRRMARSAQENERAWTTAGTAITAFGAVTTAALVTSAKAAVDWESAFAGVRKTVDDSQAGYAALSEELREMARTLPAAHDEIAGVAEAAGQLGIERESLTDFTRTMIDLGETTNLSADQAATSLARFANVMGTSQDEFDNIGSALVGLGNNFATTEAEIVDMSMRLAGAGRQAGLTEGDVLGLATALSSVGIESEAGGTAFSRVLTEMGIAVDTQDEKLRTFAEVAGMTADQFREAWASDSGGAVTAFVEGLGRIQESGESLEPILSELGMTDIRIGDALRRSASASDIFSEAMARGNEEYALNNALTEEAAQRYETTAAKLAVFRNNVRDAAISLGEQFLPALEAIAGLGSDVASWLSDLPDPLQKIAAYGGAAAAGVSLMAGGFLLMAPRAVETYKALQTLGIITPTVTTNLRRMAGFMTGPWGLAIAGAVAAIGYFVNENRKKKAAIEEVRQTLDEETGALTDNTRAWAARAAEDAGALEWAEKLGLASGTVTEAMLGNVDAIEAVAAASERANADVLRHSDAWGAVDTQYSKAADAGRRLNDFISSQSGVFGAATESHARMNAEMESGVRTSEHLAVETERLTAQAEAYLASQEGVNAALADWVPMAEQAARNGEDAAAAYAEWATEMAGFSDGFMSASDALSTVNTATQEWAQAQADATDTAEDSWEDFWDGQSVSVDEWIAELERMANAQAEWETNMVLLSGRVSQSVIDELARLGTEGAPLVAELVDASDEELARLEAVMGDSARSGSAAFASGMADSGTIIRAAAEMWGQGIADEIAAKLASGEMTAAEIVAAYDLETTIAMLADPAAFNETLNAAIALGNGETTTPKIDGDPAGFEAALNASLDLGNSSEATAAIDGDAAGFGAELGAALGTANNSSATASIEGNAARLYGTVDGALGWISRQSATVSVYAQMRTSAASIVSNLRRSLGSIGFPGYMAGGYTGNFATNEPAGIVHGREFVSTASTTADPYNRQALEFMHSGRSMREWAPPAVAPQMTVPQPALVGAATGGSQQPIVVSVQVDSREIARANAAGAAQLGGRLSK